MALFTIVVSIVLFFVSRAVYRLWFSPLAHIPGPRIAGMHTYTIPLRVVTNRVPQRSLHGIAHTMISSVEVSMYGSLRQCTKNMVQLFV
jgi:hypothetical protein